MPVPFPPADAPVKGPPDVEEARVVAGAVAAAVAPSTGLTDLQRVLIESLLESMTGFPVPAGHVPRVDAAAFARALAPRTEAFRRRMVQFMLLCAFVLSPLPEEVALRLEEYARELSVDDDMLRIAGRYSHGSLGLALIDFQRSGYMQTWDPAHSEPLHTSRALSDAWEECVFDATLAKRWESLRDLGDGTLGGAVGRFYDARGLRVSRTARERATVTCAARLGACARGLRLDRRGGARGVRIHRARERRPSRVLLARNGREPLRNGPPRFGRRPLPVRPRTSFSGRGPVPTGGRDAAGCAVRGAREAARICSRIDWFEHASRPIDEVRAEFGIVDKSERALEAGSVGPWERGGITPYQYECGQRAAEAAGRPYESYGAVPG